MPTLLGSVIAKALAFADTFLNFFATATPAVGNVGLTGACGSILVYNAEVTPCGSTIAGALAGLCEVGLAALNSLLAGLLAV